MFKTFNPEHCSLFVVLLLEHIFNFTSHINKGLVTINYGFMVASFDFLQIIVCIIKMHHTHNE